MVSSLKMLIKHALAQLVYHSGLFQARVNRIDKDHFLVLMYHRILPRQKVGPYVQPGMFVDELTFEQHLIFLKKHFAVRPFGELCDSSSAVERKNREKLTCYLTFDDAWSDFYDHAYPSLLKYKVPATVFLPTAYIGGTEIFWTEYFACLCAGASEKNLMTDFAASLQSMLAAEGINKFLNTKRVLDDSIQLLKELREEKINVILDKLNEKYHLYRPNYARSDFLIWEQINIMMNSGLISFGSHTSHHSILTKLNNHEMVNEIEQSRQTLITKQIVDESELLFCYPSGRYNNDVIHALKKVGYKIAVTTKFGWNNSITSKYELQRIGMHQDVSKNDALTAYRIYSGSFI